MSEAEYLDLVQQWAQKAHMDLHWLLEHGPDEDWAKPIYRNLVRMEKPVAGLRMYAEHRIAIAADMPALLGKPGDNYATT